jgi:hypothetical protein
MLDARDESLHEVGTERDAPDALTGYNQGRSRLHCARMIHPYSNATQTRWDHGEFKVQLNQFGNTRPVGYCEGSSADLAELHERAESEGARGLIGPL